jgi:hypothetical protein
MHTSLIRLLHDFDRGEQMPLASFSRLNSLSLALKLILSQRFSQFSLSTI